MTRKALYRVWRPHVFADVIGQDHIVRTLRNALAAGRVAHAMLLSGPRGTGKTSVAKLLAKALNCTDTSSTEPCNQCATCVSIGLGTCMDVIELDAASHRGIDEIRDMRDKIRYAPSEARTKVYIIDEVHMLTTEAFNALLKTLEEPPPHVVFVLATTEPQRVPATIHSRCQRFDFRRITLEEQRSRLRAICDAEAIDIDDAALARIARMSEGGMRDALSILDQVHAYAPGAVREESVVAMIGGVPFERMTALFAACVRGDIAFVLRACTEWLAEGKRLDACAESVLEHARCLLHAKLLGESALDGWLADERAQCVQQAQQWTDRQLFAVIDAMQRALADLRYATMPKTVLEVALLSLCHLRERDAQKDTGWREVAAQLNERCAQLEQRLAHAATRTPEDKSRKDERMEATQINIAPESVEHPRMEAIREQWAVVLQRVREKKVVVHAWLKDGEPLAYDDGTVLIGFRSAIHRETTDRPDHKMLIESVLAQTFQEAMRVQTCMVADWQARQKPLQTTPPSTEQKWVQHARERFGADNVIVSENDK